MRRALVLGCNGILGRNIVSQLRRDAEVPWHIIGADVGGGAPDDVEFLKLSGESSTFAEEVSQQAESVGELDFVVNVAGGWAGGDIAAPETLHNQEEMWRMNVLSSLAAAHLGARCLNEDGLVVLTGALGAMDETPGMISYGIAKAAVHHLVISYPDGLPNGADICAILPGVIDTPNNRANMPHSDDWTPPEDIADEVVNWAENDGRPSSGALVQIHTHSGKTEFVHS